MKPDSFLSAERIYKGGKKMAKLNRNSQSSKEIAAHLEGAQSAVLVDYRGLTVEQTLLCVNN